MKVRPWLTISAALVGLGLVVRSPALLAMGALVTGAGAVSRGWAAVALRRVGYQRSLSRTRVFPGETVELTLSIANDKIVPLGWLRVADHVPARLRLTGGGYVGPSSRPQSVRLSHATSMLPYERVAFRHGLSGPRGHHLIGPARLESGDLFGLHDVRRAVETRDLLTVYPRVRSLARLGFPPGQPLAARQAPRALMRDPLHPIGVRDYRPEDSRRHLHWKATARRGELQAKVLQPSSRPTLMIVLNAATFERIWIGVRREVQEAVVEIAADLAAAAVERRLAVGVAANSTAAGRGRSIRVAPGRRRAQLRVLLEGLAAVSSYVTVPVERLVAAEARQAPWGATLLVVTALVPDRLLAELARVARAGRPVTLVAPDDDAPLGPVPFPVHRLDPTHFGLAAPHVPDS